MIEQKALVVNGENEAWQVKKIRDSKILGPVDFGFHMNQKDDYFCFGRGVLAGTPIPGTHRLIFTGVSPLWKTFYISTMGGAAKKFYNLGINYVAIKNKFSEKGILRITNFADHFDVKYEPVDAEKIWESGKKGIHELQEHIIGHCSNCHARNLCDHCRAIVAGPASAKTKIGALASTVFCKSRFTHVECWAGRGGLGSKLVQDHNIVGIVYGGDDHQNPHLRNLEKINQIFVETTGMKMMAAATKATTKYRYKKELNTGGTLGCNLAQLRTWLLYLNWSSIYLSEEKREEIYNRLVLNHYLKQFNEETIEKRNFRNCGESCPAMCKKMNDVYKKDYEPYEALGPNCGIFDQRAAEKANHFADTMGFDAIQVGNLVSWFMELLENNIVSAEELGVKRMPKWELDDFDLKDDSMSNAELAIELMQMVLNRKEFSEGIRKAAKNLDRSAIHKALFTPHGEDGCMAPNQYWVPAFFLPMPIQGKYFEDYSQGFKEPYELGKSSSDRMIKELYSDNTGMCRFHRKWGEKALQALVNGLYDENINYYQHHKKLAQNIDRVHNQSVFWESERVVDVIKAYLEKLATESNDEKLSRWVEKFRKDKWEAAKEYWEKASEGISAGLQ